MATAAQSDIYEGEKRLVSAAQQVGRDWKSSRYYDRAETSMERQWRGMIWPFLTGQQERIDFSTSVELAAGHGRNSTRLLPLAGKLHLVDIHAENVSFLRKRFGNDPKVEYHINNGYSLPFLSDHSVSFVYCFDAMVHFDSDVVRSYLTEFARILITGGCAFAHHSNYTGNPGGDLHCNPAWRNFMSQELFAHYASKEGLSIVRQKKIDWQWDGSFIDCLTLLRL